MDTLLEELEKSPQKALVKRKKPKAQKKETRNRQVKRFVEELQIKPGVNKVPTYVIYYIYIIKFYRKYNPTKCIGKTEFFRIFSEFFRPGRTGKGRFYYLNDFMEITPQFKRKAIEYDKKYQKQYRKPITELAEYKRK